MQARAYKCQLSYPDGVTDAAGSTPGSIARLKNDKIKLEVSGWLGDWIWSQAGAKLNVT
ncbi:hypothetical protein DY000_02015903 [Brassica cretica]|uniref:Uncharacterized protein n=1 Tax=Brassica cretica TaxID=69181 RepID=A0ABQ7CXI2_BRACR|nr:hypothetical protein DY000_02015903 [Brassica cretica]